MTHFTQATAVLRRSHAVSRRLTWLMTLLPALMAALWLLPATAQAGTITIVNGPSTLPVDGVYTDGYIQEKLETSSLTISTTDFLTGPNEIRVLQSAVITWTTGYSLTLDAGSAIIITGTIQHDGPTTGAGGVRLLTNGEVRVGTGSQTLGVAVGSRFGLTRVAAGNLDLTAGSSISQTFAQLGFHAVDKGATYTITGAISVTVSQKVTATGGTALFAYVQIGHGGIDPSPDATLSGNFSGPIAAAAGGNVFFHGGAGFGAYAHLGNGGQSAGGNHSGDHRVDAGGAVVFLGGSGPGAYVLMGNGGFDVIGNQSGNLRLVAGGNATFVGGGAYAYAQLGNGGIDANGNHSGNHRLEAGANVTFQGGGQYAYSQLGNGGYLADGNHSGDHSLTALGGDVTFQGGGNLNAYSQLGNGGYIANGNHSGDHSLTSGGEVAFQAGGSNRTYAQFGNGGYQASGSHSGDHSLVADGDVTFQAGGGADAYAQLGNGGTYSGSSHSGSHSLVAGEDVSFVGGSNGLAYAQLGNGGVNTSGSHTGNHSLVADGDVTFRGGSNTNIYAQLGNGGVNSGSGQSGSLSLEAGGDVSFLGGSATFANVQLGNGGPLTGGSQSGSLALINSGNLTVAAGTGEDAYAMIGHGSDLRINSGAQSNGGRAGDITLRVGATAVFSGSQVGHLTATNPLSVTQGNTLIGVSQNDPYASGAGQLLVSSVISSGFSSAPTVNGGQLRFYLPREDSQQIPTNARFNGSSFAVANTIPPAQLAGIAPFGAGPYIPDYSFYLGGQPDVSIAKTATPAEALRPGQALTYTLSFSNTGDITATGVTIHDVLPSFTNFGSATPQPDAGVTITQTSGPPSLAWAVGDLGAGKGGKIVVGTTVSGSGLALGAILINTATISATGDITLSNNSATVVRSVIPGASLTITKSVVGALPANAWQFTGSGGIGGFNLPKGGGNQVLTQLLPGAYTITETTQSGYTAAVSCTTGASGTNSVTLNLAAGQAAGCTFVNTQITQTLTVQKVVVGGGPLEADDFELLVDGLPVTRGVPTQRSVGQHTVSETEVENYTASLGGACNSSGEVNLAGGAHVTCTITNTYVPPAVITQTLTVNKVVVGGPLDADDFPLSIDGAPVTRGVPKSLSTGQHTVTETGVTTYTASFGGACNTGGKVNLAAGAHRTCTITNTYTPEPPQTGAVQGLVYADANGNEQPDTGEGLQGVTVTLQSEAGVAAALMLTDITDDEGSYGFANVPVGEYTLSFDPPAGYAPLEDASITVTARQTTQAPVRIAVHAGPGKVYVPVLRR